jgi:dolichyl-phosphate beta-glucosyltransferase
METFYIIIGVVLTFLVTFVLWFTAPYRAIKSRALRTNQYQIFRKYLEINLNSSQKELFTLSPTIQENPSLYLSLIVPAYNEEKRIAQMLNDYIDFLKDMQKTFEVIVVDDGSTDQT